MEDNTLAVEVLHELKKESKRNFILFIISFIMLIVSNLFWVVWVYFPNIAINTLNFEKVKTNITTQIKEDKNKHTNKEENKKG